MTLSALNNHFKLSKTETIKDFFPKKKSVTSDLKARAHRLLHFLKTGTRVNKNKLLKFAIANTPTHSDQKLSEIFQNRSVANKLKRIENHTYIPKQTLLERIRHAVKFFLQFLTNPGSVGSLAPSSKNLAKSIVRHIPKTLDADAKPRRILEVGPGTGAFTDRIIRRMNPNDELHLVEFDEDFCKLLIEKYKDIPNVTVFHQSITDFESEKYDFIVSGLPMNAFSPDFVKQIFTKFEDLSKEGTKISYFEYMVLPQIKLLFSKKADRTNLESILKQKKEFYTHHRLTTDHVWKNITPANVKHHQVCKNNL